MSTLYYNHPAFLKHDTGVGHPENADRLRFIDEALKANAFSSLIKARPSLEKDVLGLIRLIHPQVLIDSIINAIPKQDYYLLDNDTILSPGSGLAAFQAVAAVCDAVDKVINKKADNAFCAVRPPGHHAEPGRAMGFCLFNNIAIAAEYARKQYQIGRIAIVDFDVHHGNGTQAAFYQQPDVLFCSSHEMPNYPGTGFPTETGVGNIVNVPLSAGDSGIQVRKKYSDIIFPAIKKFKPELLLISAGFDAHKDDPLASIMLVEDDYRWITQELMQLANSYADNRIISSLEGGYNLPALAASVAAHVETLLKV
jgi:acetoin utilization deacetylase AcuC-like enzyme